MAHSLTQQHGASLPFTSGVRTNPLGFSFGVSSFSPHASPSLPQPPSSGFPFPKPIQPSPIGFGFNHGSTPLMKQGSGSKSQLYTASPVKKKRSRQSSLSSTSSSPTSAWATLPSPKLAGKGLDVGELVLDDGDRRKVVKRNMKRVRQEGGSNAHADSVDLGVLLGPCPLKYVWGGVLTIQQHYHPLHTYQSFCTYSSKTRRSKLQSCLRYQNRIFRNA